MAADQEEEAAGEDAEQGGEVSAAAGESVPAVSDNDTSQEQQHEDVTMEAMEGEEEGSDGEDGDEEMEEKHDDEQAGEIEQNDDSNDPDADDADPSASPTPSTPSAPTTRGPPTVLSTFQITAQKIQYDPLAQSYLLHFMPGEHLSFHGSITLEIEEGYLYVAGATLKPGGKHDIHSPSWASVTRLECPEGEMGTQVKLYMCTSKYATHLLPDGNSEQARCIGPPTPITSFLSLSSPTSSPPLKINIPGFTVLYTSHDDMSPSSSTTISSHVYTPLTIPTQWRQQLATMLSSLDGKTHKASLMKKEDRAKHKHQEKGLQQALTERGLSIVVYGPKNAGKSTYIRYLLNSLLSLYPSGIAFLDLDIGQSEIGCPSFLSLHIITSPLLSQPYAHVQKGEMAWCEFVGDVTVVSDPAAYSSAIRRGYAYYLDHLSPSSHKASSYIPLLVNTMGWVKGLGKELLEDIVGLIKPVYCVDMRVEIEGKNNGEDAGVELQSTNKYANTVFRNTRVVSSDAASAAIPPPKLRALQLLSYFSLHPSCTSPVSFQHFPSIFQYLPPYSVQWGRISFYHVFSPLSPQHILAAFNVSFVALYIVEDVETLEHISAPAGLRLLKARPPLERGTCVGLGMVRGVDVQKKCVYVITPVAADIVQHVNCVMRGNLEIPTLAMLPTSTITPSFMPPYLPMTTLSSSGFGTRHMTSRHNIQRKKLQRV